MSTGLLRQARVIAAAVVAAAPLIGAGGASGRAAATLQVCANPPATYTTIQAAIDVAASGDQIQVCAGAFSEQLRIAKTVTLVGAGAAQTTILAPKPLGDTQDVVTITTPGGSGVNVDIGGFTISGPGPTGDCSGLLSGIFVRGDAQATIHDNLITAIRDDPLDGCQKGAGIRVGRSFLNESGIATITNNQITDYQKTGIIVDGVGSKATITNNTVNGGGPLDIIAQNGIQISRSAEATVTGNTVRNNVYTGPTDASSTGILLFGNLGNVTVSGNTVQNSDLGIAPSNVAAQGGTITVSSNIVTGGDRGITLSASQDVQVTKNTVTGAGTFGIEADRDSKGNTFTSNSVSGTSGDGHFDCRDSSSGSQTADSANTWTGNTGATASPDGICSPKQEPTPEPPPPPPPTPAPTPTPPADVKPPLVIVLPPIANTPDAAEEPLPSPPLPPGVEPAPPSQPPGPAPGPPAPPQQPIQPAGPIAKAGADEIITTMKKKQLKTCAISITTRNPRLVIARGVAHAPGAGGRGVLIVRVGVLPKGQQLLASTVGPTLVDVRALCRTTAGGTLNMVKGAQAVLAIEHTVTTPGSWVPDLPLLAPAGTRFVNTLANAVKKVAVRLLRCDGYTATWPPSPVEQFRLAFARAVVVCGMLKRAGVKTSPKLVSHGHNDPIATNTTESGRAVNRRVAVTFTHVVGVRIVGSPAANQ